MVLAVMGASFYSISVRHARACTGLFCTPLLLSAAQKVHQELATAQSGEAAHEQSVAH